MRHQLCYGYDVNNDVSFVDKMAGRPRAPSMISNNVLPHGNLQMFNVTPKDIYQQMTDDMSWIIWLAEHRLIRNEHQCAVCLQAMRLTRRRNRGIGYDWMCQTCNTRTSLKTGSFFANTRLETKTIVMLMYYWVYAVKCTNVMLFENITDWHIIVDYNNFFRIECEK
jgi:ribosomal protein L37AE/L43A